MKIEAFLLEFLGLLLIGGVAAVLTQVISISPYNMEWSRQQNNAFFCAIPLAVYVLYRIYFGISFYLSSFLPKQLKPFEWYLSTVAVSIGLGAGLYAPNVQPTLKALFEYYAGDIITILLKAGTPEVLKSYQFGLRVLSLISAWFVALFVVELVIRVVLFVIVFALRAVGVLPKLQKEREDVAEHEKSE